MDRTGRTQEAANTAMEDGDGAQKMGKLAELNRAEERAKKDAPNDWLARPVPTLRVVYAISFATQCATRSNILKTGLLTSPLLCHA